MSNLIEVAAARTLDGLFRERVKRTPEATAYRYFDETTGTWRAHTWSEMDAQIARWQSALERDALVPGDRVAVMLRNSPEWVMFDIAAMGLGLVVVPLYTQDRPDNVAYILRDAGCKVLLLEGEEQWREMASVAGTLEMVTRFLSIKSVTGHSEARLKPLAEWLPATAPPVRHLERESGTLATIVYTSGTTGRPKGVMLSHQNILTNARACLDGVMSVSADDTFLSFLPLSHTFERTCGYYLTMMAGATTAYARSIQQLGEDLQTIRPTILVSVPRIYERVWTAIRAKLDEGPPKRKRLFMKAVEIGYARFEHAQGRGPWRPSFLLWPVLDKLVAGKVLARLGGRLRAALSGGAALPPDISRVFIGLGLPVVQGYGLTETAPVACANRPHDNVPASVGTSIPGVEVKLGAQDALLIRGPNVMLGYWNNPEATRQMISPDGWLNSGDIARIDPQGHVYITGRLKEIIVMSNGEKIPPSDVENAILRDRLFEQVMLLGEGKPFLTVVGVVNREAWAREAPDAAVELTDAALTSPAAQELVLKRIGDELREFPGYAQVRRAVVSFEPWSIENGLLTPTLKLKRSKVIEKFNAQIDRMYEGH